MKKSINLSTFQFLTKHNVIYSSNYADNIPIRIHIRRLTNQLSCWKCNYSHSSEIICPSCASIQCTNCSTEQMSYFQIFKLNESFDIKVKDLKPYYIKLQSLLHPDKFVSSSQLEKDYSATQSTLINTAYKILSEPVKRGLYMLKLHGYELDSETVESTGESNDILQDIFMLNFEVDEIESEEELKELHKQVNKDIDFDTKMTSEAFVKKDYIMAKDCLVKLKYRENIKKKIEDKLLELSL